MIPEEGSHLKANKVDGVSEHVEERRARSSDLTPFAKTSCERGVDQSPLDDATRPQHATQNHAEREGQGTPAARNTEPENNHPRLGVAL